MISWQFTLWEASIVTGIWVFHKITTRQWSSGIRQESLVVCHHISVQAYEGEGVERDLTRAKYYYELAAMGGDVSARHNLGCMEWNAGNKQRAVKHWMISAGAGHDESLNAIRECFNNGDATKEDFERALRAHKEANDEMTSDQREAAANAAARRI